MRFYDRFNARPPKDIEKKKAYIVGGGIAGLSAAAFLIKDAHMPPQNITLFEQQPQYGGAMDAYGNAESGYISRGAREPEGHFECLWYLCSLVPSLKEPDRTVLDEIVEFNKKEPIYCHCRNMENCGQKEDVSDMKLDPEVMQRYAQLMFTPDEQLYNVKVSDWFDDRFFKSRLWQDFSTKLAFQTWDSVMEVKWYVHRFLHLGEKTAIHGGILHTEYNEYDSIIKPALYWLRDQGVNFRTGVEVTDFTLKEDNGQTTVTAIEIVENGKPSAMPLTESDYVFFTSGSMVQNTTFGTNTTVAPINRDTKNRGCFTLWEKLATKDSKFGHPEKFISDIDKTLWMSFSVTVKDCPELVTYIEKLTGDINGRGGLCTIKDSSWTLSMYQQPQPFFPDQPEDVQFFWNYGLHPWEIGDYIKKPMMECTGDEILSELLYHLDLKDKIDEILPHCKVITCMMPYITSQFMPRGAGDRPQVIPEGCRNLAFMGQYVECGDVVFTVETSVRTAMVAVYGLLELEKPVIPIAPTKYDIRVIAGMLRMLTGGKMDVNSLPPLDPSMLPDLLSKIPSFPDA